VDWEYQVSTLRQVDDLQGCNNSNKVKCHWHNTSISRILPAVSQGYSSVRVCSLVTLYIIGLLWQGNTSYFVYRPFRSNVHLKTDVKMVFYGLCLFVASNYCLVICMDELLWWLSHHFVSYICMIACKYIYWDLNKILKTIYHNVHASPTVL